nr:ArlX3 [Paratrimastix pyriformis]
MGALCSIQRCRCCRCCRCCCMACMNKAHVLLLGPSRAGKSTFLVKWETDEFLDVIPTVGFTMRQVKLPGAKRPWEIFDFGGTHQFRPLWRHMFGMCQCVFFMVDGTAPTAEDALELKAILAEPLLAKTPLLLLLNKADLPTFVPVEEALTRMQVTLGELSAGGRPVHVLTCSSKSGQGVQEAKAWLAERD